MPLTTPDDCACCGPQDENRTIEALLARLLPDQPVVQDVTLCPVRQARGRVLAQDLSVAEPIPAFRRSAMDGYALRAQDLNGPTPLTLPLRGRVAAGDSGQGLPERAGAVRIFTGAALPPDCDRVIMQEDCTTDGDSVTLHRLPNAGANIRLPGDDLAAGAIALTAGTQLGARHLACAATLGLANVPVRRRLRVAVLSTGSELTEPGQPLRPGAIYNSNRFLLAARLEEAGFDVLDLSTVRDDPATVAAALRRAADSCDAVVSSGGVSVGDEDHVKGAVLTLGGRIDHWRLAIKPGKPVAVGALPGPDEQECLFLGLPGNPNAVFVTLMLIGLPLLRARAGIAYRPPVRFPVRITEEIRRKAGREEYISVTLRPGADGLPVAERTGHGSSAQQSALVAADALLVIPADCDHAAAGTIFPALPLP